MMVVIGRKKGGNFGSSHGDWNNNEREREWYMIHEWELRKKERNMLKMDIWMEGKERKMRVCISFVFVDLWGN
jgi:hypothetical protein